MNEGSEFLTDGAEQWKARTFVGGGKIDFWGNILHMLCSYGVAAFTEGATTSHRHAIAKAGRRPLRRLAVVPPPPTDRFKHSKRRRRSCMGSVEGSAGALEATILGTGSAQLTYRRRPEVRRAKRIRESGQRRQPTGSPLSRSLFTNKRTARNFERAQQRRRLQIPVPAPGPISRGTFGESDHKPVNSPRVPNETYLQRYELKS